VGSLKGQFQSEFHGDPAQTSLAPGRVRRRGMGGVRTSPEVQQLPAKGINERFEIRAPSAPARVSRRLLKVAAQPGVAGARPVFQACFGGTLRYLNT